MEDNNPCLVIRVRACMRAWVCLLYFNVDDLDVLEWLIGSVGANVLDLVHDIHALGDTTKDRVLVVQAIDRHGSDEELATIGVGACVGHRQRARTIVAQ